jgi:hypothetical protein
MSRRGTPYPAGTGRPRSARTLPGQVRVIGSSTFPPELIVEAQWIADKCLRRR